MTPPFIVELLQEFLDILALYLVISGITILVITFFLLVITSISRTIKFWSSL